MKCCICNDDVEDEKDAFIGGKTYLCDSCLDRLDKAIKKMKSRGE